MTATISARKPYSKRPAPEKYDAGFFNVELANIQRAIPRTNSVDISADYTANVTDSLIAVDATSGPVSVTLPAPSGVHDFPVTIAKIDASGNAVTIVATISGVTNPTLATQYKSLTAQSIGSTYLKVAST